jgi:hypothetical protein
MMERNIPRGRNSDQENQYFIPHATLISFGGDDDGEWCGSDDFPREMELVILE